MYDLCCQLPDLDIIEVGGATGTGSVSLAWALKDQEKQSKLIVVEKCEGGTRVDVGGYAENLELIQSHFSKFGVSEQIRLFPKELTFENGEEAISLIKTPKLAAFIHDADGRIDRDFYLFWPLLCEGGLIIIDDYANEANYQPISERHPLGGAKLILTYRLLNQIMEWGLFKPTLKIGKTIFGIKPRNADFSRFNLATCQNIVAEIESERREYLASRARAVSVI
ncbi:class I SAM-dependent methyltransferase [Tolypothrix sp. FACHB-123]|uniref:class I SAM-dependent methyltransferase n=1 Tax=Tolypothrix sp. FACHB-123 TaxID=2692868 RepID=UPI001A7E431F|nr:class I SAM-dependent methyltransferase [Tolypothrix sp. FACHB-123]